MTILLMRTTIDNRFVIREARPGTGFGLFALQPIHKGDFVLEYIGEHVPTRIADESESKYLFEINETWTIDGATEMNTARYINHDCRPNTEAEINDDDKIIITAARDIAAGEELTIDYGDEYFDEFIRPTGCKCASCEKGLLSPHYTKPLPNQEFNI